jgi:hypothetical protein
LAANASYAPEGGETRTHTYHWVHALRQYGTPVGTEVTADQTSVTVVERNGRRTRLFWNPADATSTATFSDGTTLGAPERVLSVFTDPAGD